MIDGHLRVLLEGVKKAQSLQARKKDPMEKYAKYSSTQKLLLLLANQDRLLRSENRGRRLRMQGLTQSYYILDSAQYIAARNMIKQLALDNYKSASSGRAMKQNQEHSNKPRAHRYDVSKEAERKKANGE